MTSMFSWQNSVSLWPGFPCGSVAKEIVSNVSYLGLIPGLGRSPGEGKGYPLQYSGCTIPWTIELMGLQRVRHNWSCSNGNFDRLYSLGLQITADSDCSHEIKRRLLLGKKAMANLDSILKSRGITLVTKVHLVKAMVSPVIMYGCESWTIKKAEHWCFWTVVLRKTLESSLDCKIKPVNPKGNQSWIFIEGTDAEAEAPILWPPDVKNWLIGKDPDAEKDWRRRRGHRGWDGWMSSMTCWTWVWASSELVMVREVWCAVVHGVRKSWTWVRDWTETFCSNYIHCLSVHIILIILLKFFENETYSLLTIFVSLNMSWCFLSECMYVIQYDVMTESLPT